MVQYSSIYQQLKACAKENDNRIALRFENKVYTYHELMINIADVAEKLVSLDIKPKDVVTVSLPNCPAAVFLFYAINKIGAISYNIHPLTKPEAMARFMKRASSKILFTLSTNLKEFTLSMPKEIEIVGINPYTNVSRKKAILVRLISHRTNRRGVFFTRVKNTKTETFPSVNPEDDAVYLNTGGTNGDPKIVRLSNRAINAVAQRGYELVGGDPHEIKMLTPIPLFHAFGLGMGMHTILSIGGISVLMMKFSTSKAIKLMKRGYVRTIIGVPAVYSALLSNPDFQGPWLKDQITAFVGGDSVPQSLIDRWNETIHKWGGNAQLFEGYGLTETMSAVNVNNYKNSKTGTVGLPLPDCYECVIDPETKAPLSHGEYGEILIGGPTLMSGYLNDDGFNSEIFITIDGKQYISTKDYGTIDKDGYLIFKQRLRRTVKINGETLCPKDVEDVVMTDYSVYECHCYGVEDDRKGQSFRLAFVKRRDVDISNEKLTENIYARIQKNLMKSYWPDKIIILDSLPHTAIGKIDERALKMLKIEDN